MNFSDSEIAISQRREGKASGNIPQVGLVWVRDGTRGQVDWKLMMRGERRGDGNGSRIARRFLVPGKRVDMMMDVSCLTFLLCCSWYGGSSSCPRSMADCSGPTIPNIKKELWVR